MYKIFPLLLLLTFTLSSYAQQISGRSDAIRIKYSNTTESKNEQQDITELPASGNTSRYHALIIDIRSEEYAENDSLQTNISLEPLKLLLQEKYSFEESNFSFVRTADSIHSILDDLSLKIKQNDNLLILISSQLNQNDTIDSDSTSHLKFHETIFKKISELKNQHTLILSPIVFEDSLLQWQQHSDSIDLTRNLQLKSRKVISNKASDGLSHHQIFWDSILTLLKENEEEELASSKLFQFIIETLSTQSQITPGWGVIQNAGDEGGDFIFIKKVE